MAQTPKSRTGEGKHLIDQLADIRKARSDKECELKMLQMEEQRLTQRLLDAWDSIDNEGDTFEGLENTLRFEEVFETFVSGILLERRLTKDELEKCKRTVRRIKLATTKKPHPVRGTPVLRLVR